MIAHADEIANAAGAARGQERRREGQDARRVGAAVAAAGGARRARRGAGGARDAAAARARHGEARGAAARARVLAAARAAQAGRAQAADARRRRARNARPEAPADCRRRQRATPRDDRAAAQDRDRQVAAADHHRRSGAARAGVRAPAHRASSAWRSSRPRRRPRRSSPRRSSASALASPGRPTVYMPLGHRYLGAPPQLDAHKALDVLSLVFAAGQPRKHVHGLKDAIVLLARYGARMGGVASDPQIASYLIDPDRGARRGVAVRAPARRRPSSRARRCSARARRRSPTTRSRWRARRAVRRRARPKARSPVGALLRAELEQKQDAAPARRRSSCRWRACSPSWRRTAVKPRRRVAAHARPRRRCTSCRRSRAEVQALAGSDINLGSPKQLQELLFEKLGLPGIKRTKTGWSTDADVLEELAPAPPRRRQDPRAPRARQAQGHVHRRAARRRRSQGRAGCTPRIARPSPRRGACRRPSRTCRTCRSAPSSGREIRRAFIADAGSRAHRRRLLADRAARPGAPVEGSGAPRRLQQGRGHPSPHRHRDVRRGAGGRSAAALGGQDDQLRHRLRPLRLRPRAAARHRARRRQALHRRLLEDLRQARQVHAPDHRGRLSRRRHAHAARALPAHPRAAGAQPPGCARPASAWRATRRSRARRPTC